MSRFKVVRRWGWDWNAIGWNGGALLAGGGSKIPKNNETMESGRIETLWDTVHKGIPRVAPSGRKGGGKVRRLGRATCKAKGIKSFRRDFNQDPWPRLELDKKLIQGWKTLLVHRVCTVPNKMIRAG